jgi:hypothetical protein
MYRNTDAEIRPELQVVVQEALEAEKFFIADKVFTPFGVGTKTGEYRKILKGSGNLLAATSSDITERAPRTAYKEVDRSYEKASFACKDRGLTEVVDDSDAADLARFFDSESVSTRLVLSNILRAQEKRVAAKVMNESIWGKADATAEYTEANIATIDVARDIEEAIARVHKRGEAVNTIILSRNIWKRVRRSQKLREYIFGGDSGGKIVTKDIFLATFQDSAPIQNLMIAEAVESTARKGQSVTDANLNYIWGDDYIWLGNVQAGAPEMGGAGRIFYWQEDAEFMYVVESYREEARRSNVVRVRQHNDEHVINECAGTLIKTGYTA